MIVECPNCNTKYNLDDSKIGPGGAKLKCTRCQHVFPIGGLPDDDPLLDDLAGDGAAGGMNLDGPDDTSLPDLDEPSSRSEPDADSFGDDDPDDDDDDLSLSLDNMGKKKKKGKKKKSKKGKGGSKKGLIITLVLLLLLGGAGAGLWYTGLWMKIPGVSALLGTVGMEVEQVDDVKDIALENVRQYFVKNQKAGQLLVIEGKAVNRYEVPKELIKVDASLFDAQGMALANQQMMCGNILSFFQLQILTREEIEAALNSEMGVLSNNTDLPTGMDVPFMIVFFDPPQNIAEFGVKVVEAKDPPPLEE